MTAITADIYEPRLRWVTEGLRAMLSACAPDVLGQSGFRVVVATSSRNRSRLLKSKPFASIEASRKQTPLLLLN